MHSEVIMNSGLNGRIASKVVPAFAFDLRSLAAFRICLGLLILFDLLDRGPDIRAHYTDEGLFPRQLLDDSFWNLGWHWSLHHLSGSPSLQILLFSLSALAAISLIIGWKTRWVTIVSWILLCSLHARNPAVLHGGDALLRQLLFFSIFLPLGARCSLDSNRRKQFDQNPAIFNLASLGMVLQVAAIYWFSLFFKSDAMWTETHDALWYTLNYEFTAKPFGVWLTQFPGLLKALTILTLIWEAIGPLIVILSWRKPWLRLSAICLFWAFHLGIYSTMAIGSFSAVCMLAWIPLLPGGFWSFFSRTKSYHPASKIALAGGACSQVIPGVAILMILFWNGSLADKDARSEELPSWFQTIVRTPMWNQRWMAFSNEKGIRWSGWMVVEGTDAEGNRWDLIDGGQLSGIEKPASLYDRFPSERWRKGIRKYLSRECPVEDQDEITHFFKERWESLDGNKPISRIRVLYYVRWIESPDKTPNVVYQEYEFFIRDFEVPEKTSIKP